MVVAFFSDGPFAEMAALLVRTGLVAIGSDPVAVTLQSGRLDGRGEPISSGDIVRSIAGRGDRDMVLALPGMLLTDVLLTDRIDVMVRICAGTEPAPARAFASSRSRGVTSASARVWHMSSCASHGLVERRLACRQARVLPVNLPGLHQTGTTFARDGVPCAPPTRESLMLVAVLQALAVDPDASDAETSLRELLLCGAPEGCDAAADRVRLIADRLDVSPKRAMPRERRERAVRSNRPAPGAYPRPTAMTPPWPFVAPPCRAAGSQS